MSQLILQGMVPQKPIRAAGPTNQEPDEEVTERAHFLGALPFLRPGFKLRLSTYQPVSLRK